MNKEAAAAEIARLYRNHSEAGEWAMITRLAEYTDMTPAEVAEGIKHLVRTVDGWNATPESCQRMLTPMDHAYAVRLGGQDKHAICWQG